MKRSLILGAVQVLLVMSLGGKLLIDRGRFPRKWFQAYAYDPNMPIRGRYVRLSIGWPQSGDRTPVVYFIPEHAADPSQRAAGEQLWIECTLPPAGPPRPIRLGVKKGEGPIEPLNLD